MAEENENKGNPMSNTASAGFNKALNLDAPLNIQPEGTYRWALNAVNENNQGDIGFLSNEVGNYECAEIDTSAFAVIGSVYIKEDDFVLFLAPTIPSLDGYGKLVRVTNCVAKTIMYSNCLNFKIHKQIQAVQRTRNGCEVTIYFTDNYNDIRTINIDSLRDYLAEGADETLIEGGTDPTIWDCETMKLWPDYSVPCINFEELTEGGFLPAGSYQFAVQYLDSDLNSTNWTAITQPIPVYKDPISGSSFDIKGNEFNTDTNKGIRLRIADIDSSFAYIKVAVIPSILGTGASNQDAYLLNPIAINGISDIFIDVVTIGTEQEEIVPLGEVNIPRKTYQKAKTLAQIKNRLVLGNVSESEVKQDKFQKAANIIKVKYSTRSLSAENANEDSVQSGKYYFDYRSFMRDEIYALGVVWIFKDGTESYAYHIPGREKDTYSDGSSAPSSGDPNNPTIPGYDMFGVGHAEHNRPPATNGWDSSVIVSSNDYADTTDINSQHYLNNTITSNGDIERWEIYNTAVRTSSLNIDSDTGVVTTSGELGYYECRDARYPNTLDCEGNPVYPYSKKISSDSSIQNLINNAFDQFESGQGNGYYDDPNEIEPVLSYEMDKVRHHRMPDTTLETHQYGDLSVKNGQMHMFGGLSGYQDRAGTDPKIVTLGLELSNIEPPKEYADKIQGFRIVRAKQNPEDKTVIDKGIAYYNHFAFKNWQGKEVVNPDFKYCNWMQQGNYFNKHITSFACVRGGYVDVKVSAYGSEPDSVFFGFNSGDHGSMSIAEHSVYGAKYNSDATENLSSSFASNYGSVGNGIGNSQNCLNCSEEMDLPSMPSLTDYGQGSQYVAYVEVLTQNNEMQDWIDSTIQRPPTPACNDCANTPRVVQDWLEFGNGYPTASWGWEHPSHVNPSVVQETSSIEGINVGYTSDVIVYPCTNLSYHGPMSKFGKIEGAEFIKVERILIGYTWNLVCNTACCHSDEGGSHTLSGDTWAGSLTGQVDPNAPTSQPLNRDHDNDNSGKSGVGVHQGGRDDNGTTYIYSRATYHHSGIPYSNIVDGVAYNYNNLINANPLGNGNNAEEDGVRGNGNNPRDAWNYPIYAYPLSNLRLEDYVKIKAFENVAVQGFGASVFDNNSAMECLPFTSKTKLDSEGEQKWVRMPYPGNNEGYNTFFSVPNSVTNVNHLYTNGGRSQFPLDSSWSLATCDRLEDGVTTDSSELNDSSNKRGRITSYYMSFKKNSYNAYGNISNLVYTPTHNCIFKLDLNNPSEKLETGQIFGGDSFISRFAFKHTQYNARCGRHVVRAEDGNDSCTDEDYFWSGMGNGPWNYDVFPTSSGGFGYGTGNNDDVVYENTFQQLTPPNNDERVNGRHQQRNGIFNHISWYWTESFINTELRTGSQEPGGWFYPYYFEGDSGYGVLAFVDEPGYYTSARIEGPFIPNNPDSVIDTELAQSYTMNPDYNKINSETTYFALPLEYDFCKECQENHPYRISYSEQSFQEEQRDLFKYFLTENYRDIPANRGVVWNIFEYQNALFIQTEEALWKVDPSRNIVPTDEQSIYIGTGDFFSNEVQEIVESDTGYLGSQSQWALLINIIGAFWPDARHRKIFTFDSRPNDLSIYGVKNWTQENMEIAIYDQYKEIYGEDFPLVDNPANPAGAGYISAYDGRHHRVLLTKRDYVLREPFNTTDFTSPFYGAIRIGEHSGLWELRGIGEDCQCNTDSELQAINPSTYSVFSDINSNGVSVCMHTYTLDGTDYTIERPCVYNILGSGQTCIPCGDEDLEVEIALNSTTDGRTWLGKLSDIFECRSWTLSYSMLSKGWISWHSYIPNFYMSSKDFFISGINKILIDTKESLSVWRHELNSDHSNYQSYYGCIEPHSVEVVTTSSAVRANIFENIHFLTDASKYNVESREYYDDRYITFDSGYLYNSYQITDTLNFDVKDADVPNMAVTSVTENYNSCILDRKERVWGMNGFRDMAIDRNIPNPPSLFTNEWENISTNYYIDKVINPLAVDQNKNWFEQARMVDKYLGIRLFFSNLADPGKHRLVTNYLFGATKLSSR